MKKARKILIVLLAVVFVGSTGVLIRQLLQYREGAQTYSEAEELVGLPDFSDNPAPDASVSSSASSSSISSASSSEPKTIYIDPYADALAAMDFSALREVNTDVLGWILIPGTKISYPLVQGADNQYYLNRTWKKWSSVVGAIFLECSNSGDFSDFNTIVYGHRMNDGSMFAGLKNYKQKSYFKTHSAIYITDDSGTRKYDIFAAYEVSTQGDTYRIGQRGDSAKQAYIDYCLAHSLYDTGVVPTVNDRIVTLSTCTGNGHATRWVVQARLLGTATETPADAPAQSDSAAAPETEAETPAEVPTESDTSAAEPAASGSAANPADAGVPGGENAQTAAEQTGGTAAVPSETEGTP